MSTKELFERVIAENKVGSNFGNLVSVSECIDQDGCVLLGFQSHRKMIASGEIKELINNLEMAFESYDFMPTDYSVTQKKAGEKVVVRMSKVYPAEYDFTDAQEYLSTKCPPDVILLYCNDSLEKLWDIFDSAGDQPDEINEAFCSVASTLKICKGLMNKITLKKKSNYKA